MACRAVSCWSLTVQNMTTNQTDKAVLLACGTTALTFLTNAKLGSVWLLYLNVLLAAAVFAYVTWRRDGTSHLIDSMMFGVAASLTYLPLDWLFSRRVGLIFYLILNDVRIASAPLSLLLTWMVSITLLAYLYRRLNAIWRRSFFSAAVAGVGAFAGSTLIGWGSQRLWIWNHTRFENFRHIGPTPISVPVALGLTFLLLPYYFHRQHPIVAGIRCGLFMGAIQFGCFVLFHHIGISSGP